MPVPWRQLVQLMPSILELSRELLNRSSSRSSADETSSATNALVARVDVLEENVRREAELVTTMANQLAQLTAAVTALHTQTRRLLVGQIVTAGIAIVAIVVALR